jgi:hypothetical protein
MKFFLKNKLNQKKDLNFWMTWNGPYFHKSISYSFLVDLNFFSFNMYIKNLFKLTYLHMEFFSSLTTM